MIALTNHTIDTAICNGYGRCEAVPVWISVVRNERRVVLLPPFVMSYSLTVREKEHWKNRIAARIDKRIDALCAENGNLMNQVKDDAHQRALESLGLHTLQTRVEQLSRQQSLLEEKENKAYREMAAILRGVPVRSIDEGSYGIEHEVSMAVEKRQAVHEDELLAESGIGQEILSLRVEKENLLDTVWLASSSKQIKDLWEQVDALLGNTQTDLQRKALEIPPVEEN